MNDSQLFSDSPVSVRIPPEIGAAPILAPAAGSAGDVIATNEMNLDESHAIFAEFHEGYVGRYIEFADTKAAWTFAVSTGALAYVLADTDLRGLISDWQSKSALIVGATVVLLLASAIFSFLVIVPRSSNSGEGVVFFADVAARKNAAEFVREIAGRTAVSLTRARLVHCYDVSRICAKKYGYLRCSMLLGVSGLVGLGFKLLLV